jgi:glycosyltransferase involved in cell wall biosynthesis
VIGEDCSTDGTRAIIEAYAPRYPEQIKVVTSAANVGALANNIRTAKACRGKYFATLEGDDYWHDELKLQKQVDFLENNAEYGLIHADVNHLNERNGTLVKNYNATNHLHIPEGNIYEELLDPLKYIIKTPTALFRKELFDQFVDYKIVQDKGWVIADLFTWLSMARFSKVKYLPEAMATYRIGRESAGNTDDFHKKLKIHRSVYEIRLYFIEKYGSPEKITEKVKKYYLAAMIMDALKLKDRNLLKWIKVYKKENTVSLGVKYSLLLSHVEFLSKFWPR